MSDETTYDPRTGGFDPERFFAMARNYGHGRALGLEYRQSAENWMTMEAAGAPGGSSFQQ